MSLISQSMIILNSSLFLDTGRLDLKLSSLFWFHVKIPVMKCSFFKLQNFGLSEWYAVSSLVDELNFTFLKKNLVGWRVCRWWKKRKHTLSTVSCDGKVSDRRGWRSNFFWDFFILFDLIMKIFRAYILIWPVILLVRFFGMLWVFYTGSFSALGDLKLDYCSQDIRHSFYVYVRPQKEKNKIFFLN